MLTPPAALLALLFASGEPLTKKQAATILECTVGDLSKAISVLHESLTSTGLTLLETEEDIELRTASEAAEIVNKLRENELSRDLGKAGLETLAVIAYQRGATRGEVDWVRGVNSSTSIRSLQMRGLIEGKEDSSDRRRIRYHLTTEALAHLGISSSEHLPRFAELSKEAEEIVTANTEAVSTEYPI